MTKLSLALTAALAGSAAAFAPQASVNKVAAPRYELDWPLRDGQRRRTDAFRQVEVGGSRSFPGFFEPAKEGYRESVASVSRRAVARYQRRTVHCWHVLSYLVSS